MRRIALGLSAGLLTMTAVILAGRPDAAPPPNVELVAVRYSDLGERIKAQKGRVVVVDFWADYCPPCKREFPKLIELHRKYAADGLVCVSVSLDDAADADARERAIRFLTDKKAMFANYLLDEPVRDWQAKLKIDGPPCVFVFNRAGDLLKRFHDDVDYREIERIAIDALKEQP
jgi:thiol-disulfide isomerase/thioredoxin